MSLNPPVFNISYFIEPGCLGANGKEIALDFCAFLNKKLNASHASFCQWQVLPLIDTSQKHMRYLLNGKKLNQEQASRYLSVHGQVLDTFENTIDDVVVDYIEEYLGR